jgi:CCR4-NOT transcription complex subunit 4
MLTHCLRSDDHDLPSIDAASVDALVADNIEFPSRTSTPSVPPGFSPLPHAHPAPASGGDAALKPQLRVDPTSATFTPTRVPPHAPRVATPLANVFIPSPSQATTSSQGHEKPASQVKQDVKSSAAAAGLSKSISSQSSVTSPAPPALQPEDFPALESSKVRPASQPDSTKTASPMKVAAPLALNKTSTAISTRSTSAPVPQPVIKPIEKRPPPGLANISAPAKSAPVLPETPAKPAVSSSAFPPLSASTPPTAPVQSPMTRSAKILRVASTPRSETLIAGSGPSSATSAHAPPFPPSRQPSLVSISRHERPGTPTSEITDNASTTSASMSRANSPPPSKIGSAPVRTTTKSMQKKQRAQKAKERELVTLPVEPQPEAEIAPIQGRKKKQKKEKTTSGTAGGSTPAASRPPSPRLVSEPSTGQSNPTAEVAERSSQTQEKLTPVESKSANKTLDSKGEGKAKAQHTAESEPVHAATKAEVAEKPIPTPASVLQDLISAGLITDIANLYFLKAPSMNSRHQELQTDLQNAIPKLTITPEDRATLLSGRPVHKNVDGPNRIMLTPNGDCVRNLTPEEEERYLELQSRIAQEAGPTAFFSAKHHANNGFSLIGGRAVPNGPPAFFPQSNSTATPMDPVSKIQRDEALSYINQYVLPSLSTNSQLEKALNANALNTEPSAWAPWGNEVLPPRSENIDGLYGVAAGYNNEGILATGLEGMTAHFAIGKDIDRGQPLGNVTMLSLGEAETAMQLARKETEALEKKLNALMKKNRRLLLGSGH